MNTKIRATLLALALLTALLTTLSSQGESLADSSREMAIRRALLWLRTRQQADGSIPNIVSDAYNGTNQAVLAIVAGNQDPHTWLSSNNQSPIDYLAGQAITQTDTITETGTTARLTLAVVAAGEDPYHFGGVNLMGRLQNYYDPTTGQYGLAGDVVAQSLSMLAVSAAVTDTQLITQTVPTTATNLLKSWQQASGGWNIADPCVCGAPTWCCPATGADIDATGLAVQALIAAGEPPNSTALVDASNYLASQQQNDGGWDTFGTTTGNTNSTAWALQAILALGEDPQSEKWTSGGKNPFHFLLEVQQGDGKFQYSHPPPVWSPDLVLTTVQAVPALAGRPLPLRGRYVAIQKGLRWLQTQQQADGSIPSAVADVYNGTNQAVLAIVAGGQDPLAWDSTGPGHPDPIDYLKSQAISQTTTVTGTGSCALTILAAGASGQDPASFGGVDLVATLAITQYNPATGQYGLAGDVVVHGLSMIALKSDGQTIPVTATNLLKSWQQANGGWNIADPCVCGPPTWCCPAYDADIDATGLAIQALVAAGEPVTSPVILNALDFLDQYQQNDGGWDTFGGPAGNTNSTAWALQGIMAALQDPQGADWVQDNQSAWDLLLRVQDPTGYFEYSAPPPPWGTDLVLNTIQAIPALAGRPFPYLDEMWVGRAWVDTNLLNGDFYATALYAQDVNQTSTAEMRYRPAGGAWGDWQPMFRATTAADAAFVRTVSGLDPGTYQFEFKFGEVGYAPDVIFQGASLQSTEASWIMVYLPALLKNSIP